MDTFYDENISNFFQFPPFNYVQRNGKNNQDNLYHGKCSFHYALVHMSNGVDGLHWKSKLFGRNFDIIQINFCGGVLGNYILLSDLNFRGKVFNIKFRLNQYICFYRVSHSISGYIFLSARLPVRFSNLCNICCTSSTTLNHTH